MAVLDLPQRFFSRGFRVVSKEEGREGLTCGFRRGGPGDGAIYDLGVDSRTVCLGHLQGSIRSRLMLVTEIGPELRASAEANHARQHGQQTDGRKGHAENRGQAVGLSEELLGVLFANEQNQRPNSRKRLSPGILARIDRRLKRYLGCLRNRQGKPGGKKERCGQL